MNTPLVSVCCLVYNHEPFLRECFEGFVMQKTNFPIEVLVHDDASTDHSADIIREYTEKYPDIFKPIYQTENQYSRGVDICGVYQFPRVCGKYIAMCEGDDYWTDPLKLQKQVDFLEENEEFAGSFHNANIIDGNGKFIKLFHLNPKEMKKSYDFTNSIKGWFMPTASLIFRKRKEIDDVLKNVGKRQIISGDRLIIAAVSSTGLIYYHPEVMSVYRKHAGGISSWGNQIKIFQSNIYLFKELKKYFTPKYKKQLSAQIFRWHGTLALKYYEQSKYLMYVVELLNTIVHIRSFIDLKSWTKNYLFRK